jgi:neutral ceramidase
VVSGWRARSDSPLLAFLTGGGRARFSSVPAPAGDRPLVAGLLAGAAEADITPPPGMPKAGYSANAHDGAGFRTRLRARVLHLRAGTASLAVVQCDLLGGSSVVHHLVARELEASTDVPFAGLFIGATHTHAGPGQFLGTDFYNRFASNRAGFDPAYTQFLVEEIAAACQRAVASRRPALLAHGRTDVWGLTRNRSLAPHVRNPEVGDKRTEPQRKFVAINPWLHLIRADVARDDGGHDPLAAVAVFSVHGTGISMRSADYNADVWAYLCGELGDRIERAHGCRPVVGAIQGTHADVAPAIHPGLAGHLEAARVGRGLGAEAAELYERLERDLTDNVQLGAGLREVNLDRARGIDGIRLPTRPAVGAALVAGAHENTTPVIHRLPPFRAGRPKRWGSRGPQGAKWVLGSKWLQPLILPTASFPRVLPLQVLRIGDAMLAGLPFELTVETGRRIQQQIAAAVPGAGINSVVVSSVANEYSGYATTPEEYGLQHYEGGHTLYGPMTQPFLAAHVARLAAEVATSPLVQDVLAERTFDLRAHRYLPVPEPRAAPRQLCGPAVFTDPTRDVDGYWELTWLDAAPANLSWHAPLVRVEAADSDDSWVPARHQGRVVDDSGWDLEVVHLGAAGDGHRYAVRWWDPTFRSASRHRFVLVANGGQPEMCSQPFD